MSKTLNDSFRDEKNKLESGALIYLYEFDVSGTPYRVAEYDETVTFNGLSYSPLPIKRGDIEQDNTGKMNQFIISVANPNRIFGGYVELYDGLINTKVIITRVFSNLLSVTGAYLQEEYYVRNTVVTEKFVALTVGSKFDVTNQLIPKRMYEKNYCQWEFKGIGCYEDEGGGNYTAPLGFTDSDNCDHSLDGPSGCEFHTNEARYGGFFGIPQDGSVIRI